MQQQLRSGEHHMLVNLGQIFNVHPGDYGENRRGALVVLSLLYALPAISDKGQARQHGRALLELAHSMVPRTSTPGRGPVQVSKFTAKVMSHVALLQEIPSWHANLKLTSDGLTEKYAKAQSIQTVLTWLGGGGTTLAGASAFAGAGDAALAETLATGSLRSGARVGASRLAGLSAGTEQLIAKLGITKRGAGIAGAILALGVTAGYASAQQNLNDIEEIALHRLKDGTLTAEQFKEMFPKAQPGGILKYWQYYCPSASRFSAVLLSFLVPLLVRLVSRRLSVCGELSRSHSGYSWWQ